MAVWEQRHGVQSTGCRLDYIYSLYLQSKTAKQVWLAMDVEDHVTEYSEWAEVSGCLSVKCSLTLIYMQLSDGLRW